MKIQYTKIKNDTAPPNSSAAPSRIRGQVTTGTGSAAEFLSLSGYVEQFEALFDYTPYPGTLNVTVSDPTTCTRTLGAYEGTRVDEWERNGRTFGGLTCYPCSVGTRGDPVGVAGHVVEPDRSDHGDGTFEVIAPDYLRAELSLDDGDGVVVTIAEGDRR